MNAKELTTPKEKVQQLQEKLGLAPPNMRQKSFTEHVEWLNAKIQGWRNYYTKLNWYILQRFTKWYAKKRQRARWMSSLQEVRLLTKQYGLKTLL